MQKPIDDLSVAAMRSLIIDMTSKAKSGHPGLALGSAPAAYALFNNNIIASTIDPTWINRDRFVLASGHASPLLYSLLHLCGYPLSMEDIKQFRQLNSLTPGHPEVYHTPGVDATSGPLGQGVAQAVGFALCEKMMASTYNRDEFKVINHYTYCICGDGDMMEGITQEAISLAGLWRLNKLIVIYDANQITLDGKLDASFDEDVAKRFKACNWNVLVVPDGNDLRRLNFVMKKARMSDKPTLIINNTIIGYGSRNQGTHKVHGAPLDAEDVAYAKKVYGYDYPSFTVPEEVYDDFKNYIRRGNRHLRKWKRMMSEYSTKYKELSVAFHRAIAGKINPVEWPTFEVGFTQATRNTSQTVLNVIAKTNRSFFGGSADVAGSVMTTIKDEPFFTADNASARNFTFGVREFAMCSIANGVLLHRGFRPYIGAFLVFSDYMKAAIRMACLEKLPMLYLFSHDTIAVGEDGPTHQPIEQLAMLRSIPGMIVFRPSDANELVFAYRYYLEEATMPVAIILTRQNVSVKVPCNYNEFKRGAMIVEKSASRNPYQIIASGSEVNLALAAKEILFDKYDIDIKVVSMPSLELLRNAPKTIKNAIIGDKAYNIALEMLSPFGLHEIADHVIGIDRFGVSAPLNAALAEFGFTPEAVAEKVYNIINS